MTVQVVDKGWERIVRELGASDGSFVKVGFVGENNPQHKNSKMDMASLAAIHEFGADEVSIPARPFMSQAFDKNRGELNDFISREYNRVLTGQQDAEGGLKRIGDWFKGKIQKEIKDGDFKSLAASTIAAKSRKIVAAIKRKKGATTTDEKRRSSGGSTPLIETGQMMQSVDHEVVMK
ncbi:MAG TPA: hypothetical protein DF383_10535 [Deltaproteobacteria bacterium]|nr:hypothetical protein [Deltaproteobacteria bacterium]